MSNQPIAAHAALARSTITLGEPIILEATIQSGSIEEVVLQLLPTDGERKWLSWMITDDTGAQVPLLPDQRGIMGGLTPDEVPVNREYPWTEQHVLSQWFVPSRPGQYRVRVSFYVPYRLGVSDQVHTAEQSLLLMVEPENQELLLDRAVALATAVRTSSFPEYKTAIDALFSMPESYAVTAWKALATDLDISEMKRLHISSQLERLASQAAVNILEGLAWPETRVDSVWADARASLMNIWYAGDFAKKQRIGNLFVAHEGSMPAVIGPQSRVF